MSAPARPLTRSQRRHLQMLETCAAVSIESAASIYTLSAVSEGWGAQRGHAWKPAAPWPQQLARDPAKGWIAKHWVLADRRWQRRAGAPLRQKARPRDRPASPQLRRSLHRGRRRRASSLHPVHDAASNRRSCSARRCASPSSNARSPWRNGGVGWTPNRRASARKRRPGPHAVLGRSRQREPSRTSNAAYRRLAARHHPDARRRTRLRWRRGALNGARDELLKSRKAA